MLVILVGMASGAFAQVNNIGRSRKRLEQERQNQEALKSLEYIQRSQCLAFKRKPKPYFLQKAEEFRIGKSITFTHKNGNVVTIRLNRGVMKDVFIFTTDVAGLREDKLITFTYANGSTEKAWGLKFMNDCEIAIILEVTCEFLEKNNGRDAFIKGCLSLGF